MANNILDVPLDQFMAMLPELAQQGVDTDNLLRMYRSQNSPLAGVNAAADSARQEADAGGRRSIVGGLFTKDEGTTGMDAVRSVRPSLTAGLLGALSGAGQAVDAPAAAAQGLIPQSDMALEALGTAGLAMTGGGAAAGRGVLDYDPNTARIFAGPRAKTADLGAMTRAQEMAARGVSRDDIWRDTGWFTGADGNWRFEIDDSAATFNPSVREGWGVGNSTRSLVDEMAAADDLASAGKPDELIERVTGMRRTDGGWQDTRPPASVPLTHTGLADAYNFDGLAVRDQPALTAAGYDGAFDGDFNSASPNAAGRVDYSSASKDPRSTILHELQHAVDKQEGFQPGGSVEGAGSIDNYRRLASEVGARNTQARRDFTPSNRAETPPWLTQDTPDASQILANADTSGGLLATAASDALTPSQQMARRILDMRAAGRARDVTDDMMAQADPQYMFNNTPLPMDEDARYMRSRAQGFDTKAFHGGRGGYDRLDPEMASGKTYDTGIWAADDPDISATYNGSVFDGTQATYPLALRTQDYGVTDWQNRSWGDGNPRTMLFSPDRKMPQRFSNLYEDWQSWASTDNAARAANEQGLDGLRINNVVDIGSNIYSRADNTRPLPETGTSFSITNPTTARSKFARFDPEFAHLSDLNAANVSPTAGSLATISADDEEQRKRDIVQRLMPSAQNLIRRQ